MTYTVCEPNGLKDRDCILDLWRRNLPEANLCRYDWLYETGQATGLLLHTPSGQVVGSTGVMRRTFSAFGRILSAGQPIDLNVDRDHRTLGPAMGLSRAVTGAVDRGELSMIYGFPNRQSEAVLRRLGYQVLGDLGRWVRPISCRAVLRHRAWPERLSRLIARGVDPILWLRSPETYRRLPAGFRVESAEDFDLRFDRLWMRAAERLPIVGERTSAYLRWRFLRCPGPRHRVLCLSAADGELLAYLVYDCRECTAYLGDFLFSDAALFEILLAEFLRRMRRQRVEAVVAVYLGNRQVCRTLTRLGFWQRPSDWKTMVYTGPKGQDRFGGLIQDIENWHLTRADIDTDE